MRIQWAAELAAPITRRDSPPKTSPAAKTVAGEPSAETLNNNLSISIFSFVALNKWNCFLWPHNKFFEASDPRPGPQQSQFTDPHPQ